MSPTKTSRKGTVSEPYVLDIELDRSSSTPLHAQISEPLERLILAGTIPMNTLIEDEVSMAKRLNVSRPTTRRALQDLVNRGLLTRRRGIGTRVTPSQVHRPVGLTSLNSDLQKAGFETSTDILSYEVRLAGAKEAELLQCEEGIEIVRVERVRFSNGEPLALLVNLLPGDISPTLTELSEGGLYDCMRARGVVLSTAQHRVGARNASDREAQILSMHKGEAVLTMKQTVFDKNGRAVEYGSHIYNPTLYQLSFTSAAE
ncbi:GntR family transcriptional regulator [Scrofimicrobium sp. R131]|uniref:GntR family transcriptional regulator n=1 Tax=Scrofimicrobium appendicitidis TaxID=3079930 RepID=A0AAU7V6J7_9ACTO